MSISNISDVCLAVEEAASQGVYDLSRMDHMPDEPSSWLNWTNFTLAAAGVVLVGAVIRYAMKSYVSKPDRNALLHTLIRECSQIHKKEGVNIKGIREKVRDKVEGYVEKIWPGLKLPACCGSANGETAQFLKDKLYKILINKSQDAAFKTTACQNVVDNFVSYLDEVTTHIQDDLTTDKDFCDTFGIDKGCSIRSITPLGEETHNRGRIPFLISLSNGKEIVYKPRSMKAEQVICGKKDGIFSAFEEEGLGVYAIYDKEGQNYGYSEYIKNRRNHFDSREGPEELDRYARKFIVMDLIGSKIGLSDLHQKNVIVRGKKPFLIDAEVAMLPTGTKGYQLEGTCLLSGEDAGYQFFQDGPTPLINESNRVRVIGEKGRQIEDREAGTLLTEKVTEARSKKPSFTLKQEKVIREGRKKLEGGKHRVILVDTGVLGRYIMARPDKISNDFVKDLKRGAEAWGFTITCTDSLLQELFKKDMENNDVPAFYHCPSDGMLYYHDKVIGRRNEERTADVESSVERLDHKEKRVGYKEEVEGSSSMHHSSEEDDEGSSFGDVPRTETGGLGWWKTE